MEKCRVALRCLKGNPSLNSFTNLPFPPRTLKEHSSLFFKVTAQDVGRERAGRVVFQAEPASPHHPPGASTATNLLEHKPLTRAKMETQWLCGLGDTWDPPSTQADAIGLDEPSARVLGMMPVGSLASPSSAAQSQGTAWLLRPPSTTGTRCSPLLCFF